MKLFETIDIFDISVANITLEDAPKIIEKLISLPGKKTFFGANPHNFNHVIKDPNFKRIMNSATFVYPEGIGTVLAARIFKTPLKQRTNLLDFLPQVLSLAQNKKWSIYLLGGGESVCEQAVRNLKIEYPKLIIQGYHHGFFKPSEKQSIISEINKLEPKILLLALGTPKQEVWISQNLIKINSKAFFGIGGSIDILAGKIPRSPSFMRNMGLDWFFRFLFEPKRLWRRYFIGNLIFLSHVIKQKG